MNLPHIADLTSSERKAQVQISADDPSHYSDFYYWPFEKILQYTHTFPVPPPKKWLSKSDHSNWDPRYHGFLDWTVPCGDDGIESMMRIMQTQMIYNFGGRGEYPEVQMKKLFAAPQKRTLALRSETAEHQQLQQKIFVLKYSLMPFATCYSEEWDNQCADKNIRVWRLIACYGETNLATLHDRILGPSMGWSRHYHSYKFIVPTSGVCFGPAKSDAIDQMHTMTSFTLDASKYQLCHALRDAGQRLVYVYDLGDTWIHNIELMQIAEKGDELKLSSDVQVKTALMKMYGSKLPHLSGVQLLAGELNCPPEDSNGCDGMGRYGNLLKKGAKHQSSDAAGSVNWREHKIKNAYHFDFAAHAERLSEAIAGKSSTNEGHKKCSIQLGASPLGASLLNNMFGINKARPGERVMQSCCGSIETGCAPMSETIKTRPDKAHEAVCTTCGRQPCISTGMAPLLRCGSCKSARYCGKACQEADWDNHKERCRKMKRERSVYKKEKVMST